MNRKQIIGVKLKKHRKKKNLTQVALGLIVDRKDRQVSRWECGDNMPDLEVRDKLLEVLEIKSKNFFKGV
jgi:transcriptional regulator with XRE-family HTH domain